MKRIVLIVSAILSLLILVSCAGKQIPDVTEPAESHSLDAAESDAEKETEKVKPYDYERNATIEEKVLLDENGIKITALKLDYSGSFGPQIETLVENNSTRDIMIQARNSSVNGAMVEANFTFDIAAGDSRKESIRFAKSDMALYGISAVESLEFGILISDALNWETIVSVDSIIIETSAEKTEQNHLEGLEELLYDKGGISVRLKKTPMPSEPTGYKLMLGVENNTDLDLKVQTNGVKLDNVSVSCAFSQPVPAHKTVVKEMDFSEWELKSLNVHDVNEMVLKFIMMNPEMTETVFETETITVSFAE